MKDNGGPFFPHDGQANYTGGATLRDWFAGQALAGIVQGMMLRHKEAGYNDEGAVDVSSMLAYHAADAMLAERAKEGT